MKKIPLLALLFIVVACSSTKELTTDQEKSATELLSSKKPVLENFSFTEEVELETVASSQWWFSNAVSVYFPHTRAFYKASDKISFIINESKELKLIATNASGDTAVHTFFITVVPSKKLTNSYTIKGPIQPKSLNLPIPKSSNSSNYINGMVDYSATPIERVSIRNITSNDSTLSLTVLPLDRNGNFIVDLDSKDAGTSWTVNAKSGSKTLIIPVSNVQEHIWSKETPKPLDISFVIDKSTTNEAKLKGLFRQMLPFLANTTDEDRYSLYTYNQEVQTIAVSQTKKEMVSSVQNSLTIVPWGMSAPYTALYQALEDNAKRLNEFIEPMIIMIVHSNDNASIKNTVVEVIQKARKLNIPISIIADGNSVDSYYYKLITSATGGAFYSIDNQNNSMDLVKIIQEMYYAQKIGYTLTIPFPKFDNKEDNLTLQVMSKQQPKFPSFDKNENTMVLLSEELDYIYEYDSLNVLETSSIYFGFQQSAVNANYKSMLKNIANILLNDPSKQVQIIGNTSPKEFSSTKDHSNFASIRAKSIETELLNYGVMSSQIVLKEMGASKPLHSIEKNQWEEEANRRVEIVWLDAARKPFEIVAETVPSEYEAQMKVNEWNERGIKSYYDAYLENKIPMYKVLLWGYSSKNEAEMTAKNLSKKYNVKLVVN